MSISSRICVRRRRTASAFVAIAGLTMATAGVAMADSLDVDGDDLKVATTVHYGPASNPANHPCSDRGTAMAGSIVITYDNSGNPKHYTAGESLTVGITNTTPGITVTPPANPSIPATWDTNGQSVTLSLSTTVATTVPDGSYLVGITMTGSSSGLVRDDSYHVNVDCAAPPPPANTIPSVAFTSPPTSADEGTATTFAFAITDPDAGDTWNFAAGYPDCGNGTASAAAIDSTTKSGSFDCTFPDGVVPAVQDTVKVKVVDAANAASNEATALVTVNNVAPTAVAPAFASTAVDCRNSVTLGGISFSDPGLVDDDWTVSIDWGDGSADTSFTTSTQGAQTDQTHTYNTPATYAAKITVTDKDGGVSAEATSSNSVVVAQTYAVDFLPPFDDSSPSGLIVNKMKNGRVVPVKATIYDECALAAVTDPTTAVSIRTSKTSGTGTGDPIEEYADAGQSASNTNLFRWSSDGFWIYNLDSKALGQIVNNNYRVDAYVGTVKATVDTWAVLQPVK